MFDRAIIAGFIFSTFLSFGCRSMSGTSDIKEGTVSNGGKYLILQKDFAAPRGISVTPLYSFPDSEHFPADYVEVNSPNCNITGLDAVTSDSGSTPINLKKTGNTTYVGPTGNGTMIVSQVRFNLSTSAARNCSLMASPFITPERMYDGEQNLAAQVLASGAADRSDPWFRVELLCTRSPNQSDCRLDTAATNANSAFLTGKTAEDFIEGLMLFGVPFKTSSNKDSWNGRLYCEYKSDYPGWACSYR